MIRIAIQAKGRLSEESLELLKEAGIQVDDTKRKFLSQSRSFPAELLFLRDDDIPQAVALGVADIGIVGYNEVLEREQDVEIVDRLGFGPCRISLAVPKTVDYPGLEWFNGKRIATSYPNILGKFLKEKGIDAKISVITGSVEIAPTVGMSDAIFDIVSSGGTLVSNGLKEVEKIVFSEAVVISGRNPDAEKVKVWEQIKFRINAVRKRSVRKRFQYSVNYQIGVSSYRRGKVAIVFSRQAEMSCIIRAVLRFHQRPKHI